MFLQNINRHNYSGLNKLLGRDNYLDTTLVKPWIEGVVVKALNEFPKHGGRYVITVPIGTFYVSHTLKIFAFVTEKSQTGHIQQEWPSDDPENTGNGQKKTDKNGYRSGALFSLR